jgi:hypothetical protein
MTIIESATISIKSQLEGDGAVILSREGAAALMRAHEILCAIYDNANALGHPYITGWEIDTVDYQSLEDFLYPEAEAEASK